MGSSFLALSLLSALALTSADELNPSQKQALDRQERNQKETEKKLDRFFEQYATEMDSAAESDLIDPRFFDAYLAEADAVLAKCEAMLADLDKNDCPNSIERVAAVRQFIAGTKSKLESFRSEVRPRRDAMVKLADSTNYPDLETDFDQIEDLGKGFTNCDFLAQPDRAIQLASDLPHAVRWCSERFTKYRAMLTLTGGNDSPLFKRYEATARALNDFDTASREFVSRSETEIPRLLDDAIALAEDAARNRKPSAFTGVIRQKLVEARARIDVCAGFSTEVDARVKGWRAARESAKHRIDELAATLEHEIVDEVRPPKDAYDVGDKAELRKGVQRAWKEAWPDDEILDIRFPNAAFERATRWPWNPSDRTWRKTDVSSLKVSVIIADGHDHALIYSASILRDLISGTTSYDVRTKDSEFATQRMLRDYLD